VVTRSVLEAARAFFEEQGTQGLEGTALVAALDGGPADRLVVPTQQASRADGGCWVEVPLAGKLECAAALRPGERYVARIHSHPGEAFHSAADDRNPALTHQGALSIVPFLAWACAGAWTPARCSCCAAPAGWSCRPGRPERPGSGRHERPATGPRR
jgi:hypothetical protein